MLNKCTSFKEDRLLRSTTQVMLTWPFAQARNSTSHGYSAHGQFLSETR